MIWRDKELTTIGDYCEVLQNIAKEDAAEFMTAVRASGPNAASNIGYMTGYFSDQRAKELREWLGVVHPIFGAENPTPGDAFREGFRLGKESRS